MEIGVTRRPTTKLVIAVTRLAATVLPDTVRIPLITPETAEKTPSRTTTSMNQTTIVPRVCQNDPRVRLQLRPSDFSGPVLSRASATGDTDQRTARKIPSGKRIISGMYRRKKTIT